MCCIKKSKFLLTEVLKWSSSVENFWSGPAFVPTSMCQHWIIIFEACRTCSIIFIFKSFLDFYIHIDICSMTNTLHCWPIQDCCPYWYTNATKRLEGTQNLRPPWSWSAFWRGLRCRLCHGKACRIGWRHNSLTSRDSHDTYTSN